jgi:5S rRNA maturation endonuclease (ribonuclease M5)
MFQICKESIDLVAHIAKETEMEIGECGTDTYEIKGDDANGYCPFCEHKGCFKIKQNPEELVNAFYHCFSCEQHGSIIDWVAEREKLSPVDAARKLAKEYNIELPKDFNPIQEIFDVTAKYYHNCFIDAKPSSKLARMTPVEYQLKVRRHEESTLAKAQIGWGDGGLVEFLESLGFEPDLLIESGLKNKKTGKDFLPSDCFLYPHYVNGRVSHFTIKDPIKKIAYQLPNKYSLNGHQFYGQDSIKGKDAVIVVEGENDRLSIIERSEKYGVLATIGQISGAQLDWMREHLNGKHVITLFDPDEAGDKYRVKVEKIRSAFKSLTQVKPPEEKDIDDHLSKGADLDGIISSNVVKVELEDRFVPPAGLTVNTTVVKEDGTTEETQETVENNSVIEKHGSYWRVKFKDGEPQYTKISNFTIKLKNVYVTEEGDRLREIVVVREDGFVSDPVTTNSETKVSLKSFRVLLARSADADFRGNEQDLIGMWDLIYSTNTETLVKVTRVVGRHEQSRGWLTRTKFISDTGVVIEPDESGIFWSNGRSVGIRPESLDKSGNGDNTDIPHLVTDTTPDEREELLRGLVTNLAKNLGDPGTALLMLAWFQSCAYSNSIFRLNKSFPMLFVWGSNGEGKGTICEWLMSLYDLHDKGRTAVSQLKSGVGFGRKAEYYASLPLWIDEIRADAECATYNSTFRSYYDRTPRTMGAKDGFGVKVQHVRSCFLFAGEDLFEDPATKERCIVARIPRIGREKVESYQWIDARKSDLSSIGYMWILQSVNRDHGKLLDQIRKLDKELILEAKCSSRKSKNWSVVGLFAMELAEKYMPEFDMRKFLYEISTKDSIQQKSETTVSQFFETVESIMSQEGIQKLTVNHIMREDHLLHVWFPHVYRVVNEAYHNRFAFTKNAVLAALREEPYFVSDDRKITMGINGVRRVVVTLDLNKAPDSIKNIANINI